MSIYTDQSFERKDYTETPLPVGEYEGCSFINCDLSGSDLSEQVFIDCTFTGCNLSMAVLTKTAFRDVRFKDCKMLGLKFDNCNDFALSFSFENCVLTHSSFYQKKIIKTVFRNCRLQEADLVQADLSGSIIDNCDLAGTIFDGTNLEKADLRNSYNYSINPDNNRIRKAKFSLAHIAGLLDKYDITIE